MFHLAFLLIALSILSTATTNSNLSTTNHPPLSNVPFTCGIQSQFYFEELCPSPPEPYFVKPSANKGLGVFAAHTLETGSIIMREPPILRIAPPEFDKGSGYPIAKVSKLVRREFENLSQKQQEEVIGLTHYALPHELKQGVDVLGFIFRTNAYNTGTDIGLFPKIARINHSCRPNAAYYWSKKLDKRVIYATRDISEGEEIFVSYIPLLLSREERQERLNRYGFTCKCSACTQPHSHLLRSNKRRIDISNAFKAFEPQLTLSIPDNPTSFRKAQKNAESSLQLAELLQEEGLADYYAPAYRIVAISHARVEDWQQATVWANEGYKRRVMEDPESSFTMEMHSLTSTFIDKWQHQLENGSSHV